MSTYKHALKELLRRSQVQISTTWLVLWWTLRDGVGRAKRALTR